MSFRPTTLNAATLTLGLLVLGFDAQMARAQASTDPPGKTGYGLQAGPLTGVSVKGYGVPGARGRFESVALTSSFNLNDYLYVQGVLLDELPLPNSPVRVHLGPGLAFEARDNDVSFGLAGTAGLHFFRGKVEIYLELSPRLFLLPSPEARPSAGIGFRFYP